MLGQMSNDGNDNAVAREMIGFIVVRRKLIIVRQPHKARRFTAGNQARANLPPFDNKDKLAARSTRRRPQATGHVVETHLSALHLDAVLVEARALVDRSDLAVFGFFRRVDFGAVYVTHHVKKRTGFRGRMPFHVRRIIFDKFGEGLVARRGIGE